MVKFKEGFYADVRVEKRNSTQIRYRNGGLEECKQSVTEKAFIRVFDGKMWYYCSTYKIDDLQGELDKLYESATPCADIENHPVVKRFQTNKKQLESFKDCLLTEVSLEKKQNLLLSHFGVFSGIEYVKMFVALYTDRYSRYEFYSSKGANLKYDFQLCGCAFSAMMSNGAETIGCNKQYSGTKFEDLTVSDEDIASVLKEYENSLLNAKPVEAGAYPVILAPMVAGVFAHESFGHKSEADFMIGDETMRREWAIGKKVGADILSIYDSGLDFGSGYVPYDDEGTEATKTYLIKDGVLTGRLHSAATAADLDEELTGNARAVNCDFEPIVRMTNTVIDSGARSVEELFAGVKHGYYIKDLKHGSGMSTFTIAPSLAYEIVDGKVGEPVKIAVISGNVFETLNLIDGLSNKVELFSFVTGGCGKLEQFPLNVGFGGPYVSVSKMNVQ